MTITTTETSTAAEVLAELRAAGDAITAGQKAGDPAATADGYERRAAAWARLAGAGYGRGADPDVLVSLIAFAISAAELDARDGARQYRLWEQDASRHSA